MSKVQLTAKRNLPLIFVGMGMSILCLVLAGWQLARMQEKQQVLARHAAQPQGVVALQALVGDPDGARVWVIGEFLEGRHVLLDNRIREGRPGYEWLTPLRLEVDGRVLLVNRGWLALPEGRRDQLPALPEVAGPVRLEGQLRAVKPGWVLKRIPPPPGWPKRVQALELEQLEAALAASLYPYQLLLATALDAGLEVGWPVVTVTPERHQGYAVQWGLLALALAWLTCKAGWKRSGDT